MRVFLVACTLYYEALVTIYLCIIYKFNTYTEPWAHINRECHIGAYRSSNRTKQSVITFWQPEKRDRAEEKPAASKRIRSEAASKKSGGDKLSHRWRRLDGWDNLGRRGWCFYPRS